MEDEKRSAASGAFLTILLWGGLWGIFESTVGYLLHLLPVSLGWLVWYPAACFFMGNVYRKTGRTQSLLFVGLLSACGKLLNLFLPGRIDRVINPAVSIVFEALAILAVVFAFKHFFAQKEKSHLLKGLAVFCMNTGWRALYALYLLLLVPSWVREVSVISSPESLVAFFLVQNLLTSLLLWGGLLLTRHILKPIKAAENKLSARLAAFPRGTASAIKAAAAVCLLAGSAVLNLLL